MLGFLIVLFLLLSALFSGAEIAFISADKLLIELQANKGSKKSIILSHFYNKPNEFLSTMLVGNNISLVVFTSLITVPLKHILINNFHFQNEPVIYFLVTCIITLIILLFGEFFPKTIFSLFANKIIYHLARPLKILQWLLYLPSELVNFATRLIFKYIFKISINEKSVLTKSDLQSFIKNNQSVKEDEIDHQLFEKALKLGGIRTRECMIPRTEIKTVDINTSIPVLIDTFLASKHSRLIVINKDIDEVIGYVHHQNIFTNPKSIKEVIMEIPFIPEAMRAKDLMTFFVKTKNNIACVLDEFGGVSGIVTLEDVLEELFGEIEDEHDEEEYVETQISKNEYIFSGRLEISQLNEKYANLNFQEGDFSTLSGYLVMTLESIPEANSVYVLGGCKFEILSVSDTKIETIKVTVLARPEDEQIEE